MEVDNDQEDVNNGQEDATITRRTLTMTRRTSTMTRRTSKHAENWVPELTLVDRTLQYKFVHLLI